MTHGTTDMRVGLVGYGTIGRRLAAAILDLPGFRLAGVATRRWRPGLARLAASGVPIHRPQQAAEDGSAVVSGLEEMLGDVDIVLDCTPRGTGRTLDRLYRSAGIRVIYQGGEPSELVDAEYCFGVGFDSVRAARTVRIPSCNTTALVRIATALGGAEEIVRMRAVITRSSTDPDKAFKGSLNELAATSGLSHHADDARRFIPHLDIVTLAASAPVNCGHLAALFLDMGKTTTSDQVAGRLAHGPRTLVLSGGTGSLRDLRRPGLSRYRSDCPSVLTWREAISAFGREVAMFAGIHMESIVIPETLDALQAMAGTAANARTAMSLSDRVLDLQQGTMKSEEAAA